MDAKTRLDALAGLRLVAAGVVAVGHMPFLLADSRLGPAARRMLAEGVYGLTFFFVLSGFVLAYTYHSRLASPTRGELGRYYLARLARIWPVHLLALAVVALWPIGTPTGVGQFAANALLVHAWVPNVGYVSSYNALSWTLSIECFFYLVTPLLLIAASRRGDGRLVKLAVLAWLIPAALALLLKSRGAVGVYVCVFCPLVRLGEFAIGMALGLAFVKSAPSARSRRSWAGLEVFAVGLMLAQIYYCHRVPSLFRMNGYYTPAAALVVYAFARQRGVLSRLLGSRVAVYLSDLSFAFYMFHGLAFYHLGPRLAGWDPFARAAAQVGLVGLLAAVVHHAFEVPVRAAILRIGKRKPAGFVVGPASAPVVGEPLPSVERMGFHPEGVGQHSPGSPR